MVELDIKINANDLYDFIKNEVNIIRNRNKER